ncbi:hypothetical protein ACF07T_39940 [Streptomyces sp. NPDC015184]|uniref:hypothetical protein n=1 Tax=Streptomyces sp. NPDC015184 TaxID=3364946 RepID=UPI00370121E3
MTSINPAYHSAPPSEAEREQMEAAFRAALERLGSGNGFSHTVRELARPLFNVGWVAGVRTGHTGLALADVPLPPHVLGLALAGLADLVLTEPGPRMGQLVSYHGSQESFHGRYWVTRIDRELSAQGKETVLYRLSTYARGRFRHELHWVHPESLTALPQHFQGSTAGRAEER